MSVREMTKYWAAKCGKKTAAYLESLVSPTDQIRLDGSCRQRKPRVMGLLNDRFRVQYHMIDTEINAKAR